MRWLRALCVAAPLALVVVAASGCKQNEGERCQVQSDCADGLLCILPAGGSQQTGGTCQKSGAALDLAMPAGDDLSSPPDMTAVDLADVD
jgi:hypothetical protein